MSSQTINLTPEVYNYLLDVSVHETEMLKALREETHALPRFHMQISPEQGQLMTLLIELIAAKKTLDIGTFTGYSALVVALALPSEGEVHSFDIDKNATAIAEKFWRKANVDKKITLHVGKAVDNLQQLIAQGQSGTFDFAFIDADKNNYDNYYELALKLLRQGGLVAIDNVLWGGKVASHSDDTQTQSLQALNKKLKTDERITLSMIPIGDGLTLARKR